MKVQRTSKGATLIEDDGSVLSVVRSQPGPTHSLFDVLAASVTALVEPRVLLMLGFAAGGVMAPLRGLGWDGVVRAVDLSREGEALFRDLCGPWCGDVRLETAEASSWLRRRPRARFDVILEDLSVPGGEGVTKPPVSLETLPRLIARHLAPGGLAVTNLLPVPGMSWESCFESLVHPFRSALILEFDQWENRLLLRGPGLSDARVASRRLRRALTQLDSDQVHRFRVRTRLFRD